METCSIPLSKSSCVHDYISLQHKMILHPGLVFSEFSGKSSLVRSLVILLVSGAVYSAVSILVHRTGSAVCQTGILMINAIGMVLIDALVGWALVTIMTRRRVSIKKLLPVYALSAGLTLLFAWIPMSIWLTEPWKWWLIGIGLMKTQGLRVWQAIVTALASIVLITWLFSRLPTFTAF